MDLDPTRTQATDDAIGHDRWIVNPAALIRSRRAPIITTDEPSPDPNDVDAAGVGGCGSARCGWRCPLLALTSVRPADGSSFFCIPPRRPAPGTAGDGSCLNA